MKKERTAEEKKDYVKKAAEANTFTKLMDGYSAIEDLPKLDELWTKHDNDGNGFLDKKEAPTFLEDVKELLPKEKAAFYSEDKFNELFDRFDEDKNGYLDKSEMSVLIKKVFQDPDSAKQRDLDKKIKLYLKDKSKPVF